MKTQMVKLVDAALDRCEFSKEIDSFLAAFVLEYERWIDGRGLDEARADEREACAKLCEDTFPRHVRSPEAQAMRIALEDAAQKIRARGES